MLDQGVWIEVQLPGKTEVEIGKVIRCNKRGSSCTLKLQSGEQVTVNLTSLDFKVVDETGLPSRSPATKTNTVVVDTAIINSDQIAVNGHATDGSDSGGVEDEALDEDSGDEQELDAFDPEAASQIDALTEAVEDPGAFLQPSSQIAELARAAAKLLFDYGAAAGAAQQGSQGSAATTSALPELYVDGFDPEQIWLQLDMAATPAMRRAKKLLKKVGPEPRLLDPDMEEALDDLLQGGEGGTSDEEALEQEEEEEEEEEDLEGEDHAHAAADLEGLDYEAMLAAGTKRGGLRQGEGSDDESLDESEEELEEEEEGGDDGEGDDSDDVGEGAELAGRKRKSSERGQAAFEDDFFKVDELQRFLEQAEREEGEGDEGLEGDGSEEDEFDEAAEGDPEGSDSDADMEALLANAIKLAGKKAKQRRVRFADQSEDEEEDGAEEGEGGTKAEEAQYEDFFGPRRGVVSRPPPGGAKRRRQDAELAEQGEDGEELGMEDDVDDDGASDDEADALGNGLMEGSDSDDDDDEEQQLQLPSTHERRLAKMSEKVRQLEEAAMGEKDWYMKGEVVAGQRPKNSALEVDLDFETSMKPPPQPTEESTRSLEEMIKARVAEGRFDDVVRIVAPPPETKKTTVELDDKKSSKGLGELYEEDYQRAVTGVSEDKDEEVRQAARVQFAALCAKLDALSHLHYRPKPVIEDVTVKVDVPAIMMEEVAPQFVSEASMRAPEEVFAAEAGGAPRSEAELSREDRKRRRAQKKRASKKRRSQKEEERAARAVAKGGTAPLAGRKSELQELERKQAKKAKAGKAAVEAPRIDYSKSAAMFAKIQEQRDSGGKGAAGQRPSAEAPAAQFKL